MLQAFIPKCKSVLALSSSHTFVILAKFNECDSCYDFLILNSFTKRWIRKSTHTHTLKLLVGCGVFCLRNIFFEKILVKDMYPISHAHNNVTKNWLEGILTYLHPVI